MTDTRSEQGYWDARVIRLENPQRWWWNAWHPATETELSGTADSKQAATEEMEAAIDQHG